MAQQFHWQVNNQGIGACVVAALADIRWVRVKTRARKEGRPRAFAMGCTPMAAVKAKVAAVLRQER